MIDKEAVLWFPMRVTYAREQAIKASLDELGVESFIPMEYKKIDYRWQQVPAVRNLIFIHTNYKLLSDIKRTRKEFLPLRYFMHSVTVGDQRQLTALTVPDRQMEDFIRVSTTYDEHVVFLQNMEFACRPGAKVQIAEGPFAGVKGVVKHIQKNLSVVIAIRDIAAIAIKNVPKSSLVYLSDEEYQED